MSLRIPFPFRLFPARYKLIYGNPATTSDRKQFRFLRFFTQTAHKKSPKTTYLVHLRLLNVLMMDQDARYRRTEDCRAIPKNEFTKPAWVWFVRRSKWRNCWPVWIRKKPISLHRAAWQSLLQSFPELSQYPRPSQSEQSSLR